MDDGANRVFGDLDVDRALRLARRCDETGFELLSWHEITHRNVELLELGVAAQLDDLHPISERHRDTAERVRRRNEHHVGEVVIEVEVMIVERFVLLGVEHFEQRGRRITPEITRHLVDFIEEKHGIVGASLAKRLNDPSRERANIRAPMTADLGFVTHAAQREPDEFPTGRTRNRASE
jgi:hypothetical protein